MSGIPTSDFRNFRYSGVFWTSDFRVSTTGKWRKPEVFGSLGLIKIAFDFNAAANFVQFFKTSLALPAQFDNREPKATLPRRRLLPNKFCCLKWDVIQDSNRLKPKLSLWFSFIKILEMNLCCSNVYVSLRVRHYTYVYALTKSHSQKFS
ncbi:hypothetical protein Y032_0214g2342 [Ancylostoma ceylanicum]|uniref:Uncharacterized protein n=1 Tax=Ancylostoma ceylanicum TaxID=53326 RepID=A0A016SJI7_9BILA|nr:hypothetical protein Y032_0214g2342 [Ancylostoma ceylanicum]